MTFHNYSLTPGAGMKSLMDEGDLNMSLSALKRNAFWVPALLLFFITIPCFSQIIIDPTTTAKAFGPVQLRPDQEFELCANAHFSEFAPSVTASFHPARNANIVVHSRTIEPLPGEGACTSVSYAEVGDEPIFALLTASGENLSDEDLVASAAVINGVIPFVPPIELGIFNATIREVTTFGPVRVRPETEFLVCATNAFNGVATSATLSIFLGRDSSEPIAVRSGTLQPGRGSCVSIGDDQSRGQPIFAKLEVRATQGGSFDFRRITLGGAGVINGIFHPVPGEFRAFGLD
jgi:hypothetical protein